MRHVVAVVWFVLILVNYTCTLYHYIDYKEIQLRYE